MANVLIDAEIADRGDLMAEFYNCKDIHSRILVKRKALAKGYLSLVNLMLKHLVPDGQDSIPE